MLPSHTNIPYLHLIQVVGLAGQSGDNDQEEEVVGGARGAGRKRKCRSAVTSYKEPTIGSVSALLGTVGHYQSSLCQHYAQFLFISRHTRHTLPLLVHLSICKHNLCPPSHSLPTLLSPLDDNDDSSDDDGDGNGSSSTRGRGLEGGKRAKRASEPQEGQGQAEWTEANMVKVMMT